MYSMAGIIRLGPESHLVVNRLAAMNSTPSSPWSLSSSRIKFMAFFIK
jgi:hypothetical protein